MRKIKFIILLLFLPLIVFAQKNQPRVSLAYIEESTVLKATVGYEKNVKTIDSLKQVYGKEVQEAQTELNTKLETLLKPYNFANDMSIDAVKSKLKEADKDKFELFVKENELITKSSKNYDLMLKTMYEQKVQPLLNKLNSTIEAYAKENGIKAVFTLENISPALAYIDKGINITEDIVKRLNQ